jgi:cytochrome c oxidase cbb3-type subunit 4
MDIGTIRGLLTLAILVLFLALWAWSWSRKRQPEFDAAARLPLENDDGHLPGEQNKKERSS